jgi:hypothetical protein
MGALVTGGAQHKLEVDEPRLSHRAARSIDR